MDTARFLRIRSLFDEAVRLPNGDWDHYLSVACADDVSLQEEVRALLAQAQHDTLPTSTMAPQGATTIGPYRVLRQLGAGGMGVVYLAVRDDGAFRKNVALKVLRGNTASRDLVQRFHQERQVLADLDHPNIARILDGGQTADGVPYYVMDFVDGEPLDRYCDSQTLDLPGRIRLFQQVVRAVQYLHEHLVVHRDLKHSNIMVTRDGVVKLLDFGIAKVQLNVAQAPDLTSPDYRLLTPNFASPEQVSGGAISKASDIYSLGVILYQILTGRLPHENPGDKLHKDPPLPSVNIREDLQRTPETTSQLRRRIVGDLDQIVLLCLRRDPKQRYATAADLAVDLDRFLEGRSVVARREPLMERAGRFLRRKKVAVAVAALVVLLCGAGAWEAVLAQNQTRLARSAEAEVRRLLDEMDRRQKAGRASGARKGQAKNGVMSAAAVAADVQQLRRIIQQDLGSGATARGPLSPERRDLLDRSAMYLNGISASTAGNPDLGLEVASAYQEIGVLYQNGYRDRALHAFTNAALVLAGMVEGDPRTGPYAARWVAVAELIRGLGGDVPVAVAQTTTHARGIAMDGASARRSPEVDTPAEEPMAKPEPGAATPAEPVNQAEYEEVRRLFVHASSRASTADDVMQQLQADASRQGQAVHPDIKQRINSMRDSLGLAREAMDAGKLAAAREDILAAETYASRVIKDGGGR